MFLPTKYSKFFKKIRYLLLVLLTSVILIFLLNTSRTGYAENPRPTVATFSEIRGTVRVYPNGNAQQRITPNRDFRMNSNNNDQLWVAATTPRSSSWADILFREQEQVIDPVVRVGGASTSTVYRFPCWVEQPGSSLFGWGFEKVGAACDTVTANIVSVEESIAQKSSSPKISDEAASKQITISRLEDVTLIHVYNKDGDVAVDVLVGAVRITALNGSIFNVNAGNRYIQSAELGGTDPLDLS